MPFKTKQGVRVASVAVDPREIQSIMKGPLTAAGSAGTARGYLVDRRLNVLAGSTSGGGERRLPPRLQEARRDGPQGGYGDTSYTSAKVATTSWQVVLTVPSATLLAPVEGQAKRATWLLFAVFAVAMLALLFTVATTLRRSAELAHERWHDPLTGCGARCARMTW